MIFFLGSVEEFYVPSPRIEAKVVASLWQSIVIEHIYKQEKRKRPKTDNDKRVGWATADEIDEYFAQKNQVLSRDCMSHLKKDGLKAGKTSEKRKDYSGT